jgi:LPXTG-site transpeptidase (sortase) family protein
MIRRFRRYPMRSDRRRFGASAMFVGLIALMLLAAGGQAFSARAEPIGATSNGDMPTTGGLRPGPVGQNPPTLRKKGVRPVAIKIEKAQVDSEVESVNIVNGVMENPSTPYIVAWYRGTGMLGEDNNIVMSGHLDWYDVPIGVFYYLGDLNKGDKIEVTGADGNTYNFSVDWVKNYDVASLDQSKIDEIVGKTDSEELTLITCTGVFDSGQGQYDTRMVVRASPEN